MYFCGRALLRTLRYLLNTVHIAEHIPCEISSTWFWETIICIYLFIYSPSLISASIGITLWIALKKMLLFSRVILIAGLWNGQWPHVKCAPKLEKLWFSALCIRNYVEIDSMNWAFWQDDMVKGGCITV